MSTDEDVRLAVFAQFASGSTPTTDSLAASMGMPAADVVAALNRLDESRHVVLGADGHIVMAHPFTSIPLGFSVMGRERLWWGGCAWDAFALPNLLPDEPEVVVATRCPGCGRPHAFVVARHAPPSGDQVAHFLVPAADMWDDVVHTCAHQRIFCAESCVDGWLAATGQERGYVMDLATLWRLASHWYDGRLDRGYTRRDPQTAAEYFRSVGLRGPFWGLDPPAS